MNFPLRSRPNSSVSPSTLFVSQPRCTLWVCTGTPPAFLRRCFATPSCDVDEAQISQLRCRQHVLVGELDDAQAPQSDGSRSMVEWVQAHLDVKTDTAKDLVFAARNFVMDGNASGVP